MDVDSELRGFGPTAFMLHLASARAMDEHVARVLVRAAVIRSTHPLRETLADVIARLGTRLAMKLIMKIHSWAAVLLVVACSSKPQPPAPAPAPPMTGRLEHRMANCPTAVDGASTTVVNTDDGVDVVITARDPDAQQRIRAISNTQGQMGDPSDAEQQHTGLHGGPGKIGHCPIIHEATLVTVTAIDDGATLHVKARDPSHVKQLQDETAARVSMASVAQQP